jgi:hypothetical protein
MYQFVSALGPDIPGHPDVRFYKSVSRFSDALQTKSELERRLELGAASAIEIVIYRMFHDGTEFFSTLQSDLDQGGDQRNPDEPKNSVALCYDLFSAAKGLLGKDPEKPSQTVLSSAVEKIYGFSHEGPPGHLRP